SGAYNEKIGTIIAALLPAGSVSGAPKNKTVEIITESENYERGYYTGIFGYFDGIKLDSGVMIRFIEKRGNDLYYKSGGGITVYSEAEKEYQEMIDKIYVPVT
ncbi:MAG: chorismate-binding protein, partial [Bacteroidota bacterium]